jgi:hypothetical protein
MVHAIFVNANSACSMHAIMVLGLQGMALLGIHTTSVSFVWSSLMATVLHSSNGAVLPCSCLVVLSVITFILTSVNHEACVALATLICHSIKQGRLAQ